MSDEKKDAPDNGEGKLYRVETVPPPAGEDDAYSAPTKVGPLGDAFVANLMKEAEQRTTSLARKDEPKRDEGAKTPPQESAPVSKRKGAEESAPSSKEPVSAGGTPLPRVYDDEEEDAATKLSPKATPPAIPQRPMALQVPGEAPSAPSPAAPPPPPVDLLRQYADLANPSSRAPVSGGIPSASAPAPPESDDLEPPPSSRRRTIALFALLLVLVAIAVLLWSKERHF